MMQRNITSPFSPWRSGALALLISLLFSGARAADDKGGMVYVYGTLSESACRLEMDSNRQEVALGRTATAGLERTGQQGTPVSFRIRLRDCRQMSSHNRDEWTGSLVWSNVQPAISLRFSAPADADMPDLIAVTGVSGLALKLQDARGNAVRLGSRNPPFLLSPGQNVLTYTVTPVRTPAPLRAGAYRATIDFQLFYD